MRSTGPTWTCWSTNVERIATEALLFQTGYLTIAEASELRDADRYRAAGIPIYPIGVEFGRERRAVAGFEVERLV